MTLTVILIAAAHTVPIFLAGAITGSKAVVTVVALIMCAVAFATGSPLYTGADLLAIGIMWLLSMGAMRG